MVCEELFCSFGEGGSPSIFPRFLSGGGGGGGTPKNGRVGDVEGDSDGASVVELNWFPSFRNVGMLSSFSGMGPEKRLFSMFKS